MNEPLLTNENKIRFFNALHGFIFHAKHRYCQQCLIYLDSGAGDICDTGKQIIFVQLLRSPTTKETKE